MHDRGGKVSKDLMSLDHKESGWTLKDGNDVKEFLLKFEYMDS